MTLLNKLKIGAIILCSLMLLDGTPMVGASESTAGGDTGDIIEMLTKELKLNKNQSKDLGAEIERFVSTLDRLKRDQEKEDADPDDLIRGAKEAQEEYLKAVKSILTPAQFDQYNAIREKAVRGMFLDLAEIQLMDLQPKLGLTDGQITQLTPILGDAMFQVINLAWQNAGKRLRLGQKIKLKKKLKHIQKDTRNAVSKVLTGAQLDAWDKYKEQMQQQKKK